MDIKMENLLGYKKFEKLMADFAPTFMEPVTRQKMDNENFYIEKTKIEYKLFNGFSEISKSLETLKLIEKFIHINPPQEDEITYANYLTYHIHNYLQEMYICKDRLDRYIKTINEEYKRLIDEKLLEDVKENLLKIIKSALNNITAFETGARSKHVHYERFLDEELKWLSSTTFLSNFYDEFKIESKKAYFTAKDKWYNLIKNNNEELKKLLDMYFNAIYIIITSDDKVVLPNQVIQNEKTRYRISLN